MKVSPSTLFAAASCVAVLAAVAAGLMISGSPAQIRLQKLDQERVRDLQMISSSIDLYAIRGSLPQTIEESQRDGYQFLRPNDPESGMPYEYKVVDADSYELCAQFSAASDEQAVNPRWKHPQGRHCFSLQARGRPQVR